MKTSFIKRAYLWFIHTMDKLTREEDENNDISRTTEPNQYLINVTLGDFTFSLKVTEENEAEYRQITKRLNENLAKYKSRYPNMTATQLFAFLALKEALNKKNKEP